MLTRYLVFIYSTTKKTKRVANVTSQSSTSFSPVAPRLAPLVMRLLLSWLSSKLWNSVLGVCDVNPMYQVAAHLALVPTGLTLSFLGRGLLAAAVFVSTFCATLLLSQARHIFVNTALNSMSFAFGVWLVVGTNWFRDIIRFRIGIAAFDCVYQAIIAISCTALHGGATCVAVIAVLCAMMVPERNAAGATAYAGAVLCAAGVPFFVPQEERAGLPTATTATVTLLVGTVAWKVQLARAEKRDYVQIP